MGNLRKSCPTCKVVNKVCFWGDMPQKEWKRPTLFFLTVITLIGGTYLVSINENPITKEPVTFILLFIAGSFLIFGLLISVVGCNRCVARFFGNI